MTLPEDRSGLGADIYPPGQLEHAVPEPLPLESFSSWHLPRKQWVRRQQWENSTKRLLRELPPLTDRPLRYLGLPGAELLDIEVLAELCARKKIKLRYLGFNTGLQNPSQRTTQQLAEDAIKSLPVVDAQSFVSQDDIISLSSANSLARRRLNDFESFDVINLDICDVFTTLPGRPAHLAVRNVLEYQANGRTQPWLLFLTTAIDRPAISEDDVVTYRRLFVSNAEISANFRKYASSLMGAAAELSGEEIGEHFDRSTGEAFGRILSVGIGKWLISVAGSAQWKVELKSCACYRRGLLNINPAVREVPQPELVSLVFHFSRQSVVLADPTNLTLRTAKQTTTNWPDIEQQSAVQMARKAERLIDLDILMQNSPKERAAFIEESAVMLELRNYDGSKYREWAARVPVIPEKVEDGSPHA
ncbi:MAG: hypothetical protein K8R36_04140 [Planctomycetales bacterium]|nr:hypothetical protein [Planctomycetales bacterium]